MPFPAIGRSLWARVGSSDRRTIEDAGAGYHIPPASMGAPRSVLDLGANCGATAAHYAHLWPDALIVAVEMDEDNCTVARQNLEGTDVTVIRAAASGKTGWRRYRGGEEEAFRLDPTVHKSVPVGGGVVVGSRLYDLLAAFDDRHCDFVKVDIEGAEYEVFEDGLGYDGSCAWAPLVRSLLVELHPYGAPEPPPEPWPSGRDGPSPLLAAAIPILEGLGFHTVPHTVHPHAVFASR